MWVLESRQGGNSNIVFTLKEAISALLVTNSLRVQLDSLCSSYLIPLQHIVHSSGVFAPSLMAKYIVQAILAGAQVFSRALARAVREEYTASQNAARSRYQNAPSGNSGSEQSGASANGYRSSATDMRLGISLNEAKSILNVSDHRNTAEIERSYQMLFEANDPAKGGSLYIQSKVYRAKERIDEEVKATEAAAQKKSADSGTPPGNEQEKKRTE